MINEIEQFEEALVDRVYVYELFHKALGGEPTSELFTWMASPASKQVLLRLSDESEALNRLMLFLTDLSEKTEDADYLWQAQAEFTRMFVGPQAPVALPWESPYVCGERTLFNECTVRVRSMYKAYGLATLVPNRVPDDHVALLCAFMGYLGDRALQALRARQWDDLRTLIADSYHVVNEHLNNWLSDFVRRACGSPTAYLYPQLLKGLEAFTHFDEGFCMEAFGQCEDSNDEKAFGKDNSVHQAKRAEEHRARFALVEEALEVGKSVQLFGLQDYQLAQAV